jgi:tetratricopeptide (TPR) repeat protein
LAQLHKIHGNYELAWNIFDELMNQTDDEDNFFYEDIAFSRANHMSEQTVLQTTREFLAYCSTSDDDETKLYIDDRISYIIDAWAELGYIYFYQCYDTEQALLCYEREKELSLASSQSPSYYFHPLLGSCTERMADVYASNKDIEKALTLYKEALDLSRHNAFAINVMTAARCMCKIGRYSLNYDPELFTLLFNISYRPMENRMVWMPLESVTFAYHELSSTVNDMNKLQNTLNKLYLPSCLIHFCSSD